MALFDCFNDYNNGLAGITRRSLIIYISATDTIKEME